LHEVLFADAKQIAKVARILAMTADVVVALPRDHVLELGEPVMATKFRKLSIKSRKRTLGVAGIALVLEIIVSHPRFDMAANIAQTARVAGPVLMASLAVLTRNPQSPAETAADGPVVVPVSDRGMSLCAKTRVES
jgi:hypothetical protein